MPPEPRVYSNRYEIVRSIARGGMSEVFYAHDRHLDRSVAIKVLSRELSRDPKFVERFRREAQAAANLAHANIVAVYDWGQEDDTYFIVMEYVDGESLSDLLRRDRVLGPDRAAGIAGAIAAGLAFAHRSGIVHRDVKPGNVLISTEGAVRVTDFGVARAESDTALTQTGSVMGTATYFSPEQAQGHAVDGRSDVYSLGVVLYEMVTGSPPFSGDNPVAVAFQHVREPVPPPRSVNAKVPRALEDIIMTALCKDPAARYRRIEDFRSALGRFRQGRGSRGVTGPLPLGEPATATRAQPAPTATAAEPVVAKPVVAESTATESTATGVARTIVPRMIEPPPRRRSPWAVAGVAALIMVIVGSIGVLVAREFDTLRGGHATGEVPNVVRTPFLDIEAATRILTDDGFAVEIDLVDNDLAPEDSVLSQTPVGGTLLKEGDTVTLGVSNGPGEATVPEVVGTDVATATTLATDAGFRVSTREEASVDIDAGFVIRSIPGPGTSQRKNSRVTLVVSTGAPDITVPDVVGLDSSDAAGRLGRAGLRVDTISEASDSVDQDLVISTNPAPGARAPEGSAVTMVVSSGRSEVGVPNLIGDARSSAEQRVIDRGLSPRIESLPSPSAETGIVIDQFPVAGTLVEPGTTVRLGVGDGLLPDG